MQYIDSIRGQFAAISGAILGWSATTALRSTASGGRINFVLPLDAGAAATTRSPS
jgi:hypothetical protein